MRLMPTMAFVAAMSFALAAAEVTGTWVGAMETPGGTFTTTIQVQSASPLSGTVKSEAFEGKIDKGKLDGERIYFEVSIEQGKLIYEGTVAGDELKLIVTGPSGNKYPMVCRRQK